MTTKVSKEEITKVKVIELVGEKLDPDAVYLFAFDKAKITMDDAHRIADMLRNKGIEGVYTTTSGNPKDAIKVYSIPRQLQGDHPNE